MHFLNSCGRSTSYCSMRQVPSEPFGGAGWNFWIDALTS